MTAQTAQHIRIPSSTQRNKLYDVFLTDKGYKCNCPQFVFRDKECKHIFLARQTIEAKKVREAQ